jgi:hypothetical protein
MEKTCKVINCENTSLVYSGIDALCLGGIPTETYCYTCANAYNQIDTAIHAEPLQGATSREPGDISYLNIG